MFGIRGLLYIPGYLSAARQAELVRQIDSQPWRDDLARRTQQYGYVYDHKSAALNPEYLGALPEWLNALGQEMLADGIFPAGPPDQAILNEYLPRQGIGKHVDAAQFFGPVVVSLSLLSPAVMDFDRAEGGEVASLLLEPGSLLVLRGEARYEWRHGIKPRREDAWEGRTIPRERRISVTFRTVPRVPTPPDEL